MANPNPASNPATSNPKTSAPPPSPSAPPPSSPPKAAVNTEGGTMVNVTYRPQPGDPAMTTWNGHTFHANKPTPVSAARHPQMLAQAKGNPWFDVEGHDQDRVASDDHPTDSDGYRRYAVAWFKTVTSAAEMKRRWEAEQGLRDACGVGSDDMEYLNKLYTPKLADLTKAES